MFHCTIGPQNYAEIYELCTGFTVNQHPELPNRVCNDCETKLISYFYFRKSIETVEAKIKAHYESHFDQNACDEDMLCHSLQDPGDEQLETEHFLEESLEVEQLNEESNALSDAEEFFEFEVQDPESTCRFKPTQNGQRHVKCVACTRECDIERLINNSRPEEQISVQCCECDNGYKNRRSFLKHFAIIHEKRESSFKCRSCDERFSAQGPKSTHSVTGRILPQKFRYGVDSTQICSHLNF